MIRLIARTNCNQAAIAMPFGDAQLPAPGNARSRQPAMS
jgi:hypothetical protein